MDRYLQKIPATKLGPSIREELSENSEERPVKRVRLSEDCLARQDPQTDVLDENDDPTLDSQVEDSYSSLVDENDTRAPGFENALPENSSDEVNAEGLTGDTQVAPGDCNFPATDSLWVKGQRSIYVDAFNLALDTVLENEAHLFDERERHVFDQWKALGYESQYLYVDSMSWASQSLANFY